MVFREGHGGKGFPSSRAARAFLRLLGQSLRSMPDPLDHPDREGRDFVQKLLRDLDSRVCQSSEQEGNDGLESDDRADLLRMADVLRTSYESSDNG